MKLLSDERLYADTGYCLEWLQGLEVAPRSDDEDDLVVHLYWCGHPTTKVAFAIKSFLATQDLERTQLWLWLDDDDAYHSHEENPFLRPFLPLIEVHRFDADALAHSLPVDVRAGLDGAANPAARSDVFRLLVLYNHGGIYADVDTMFLRDLHALPAEIGEFCYRWSATLPWATHAVSRLGRGSEAALAIARRGVREGSFLPWHVLRFEGGEDIDLCVLPCVAFDPLWPHHDKLDRFQGAPFDTFDDFFREFSWRFRRSREIESYRDFFAGAFGYQWHNRWDAPERPNSYFGLFDREFDEILARELDVEAGR